MAKTIAIIFVFLFLSQPTFAQETGLARVTVPSRPVRLRLLYRPGRGVTLRQAKAACARVLAVLTGGFYAEGRSLSPAGLLIWRGHCQQAPSRRADRPAIALTRSGRVVISTARKVFRGRARYAFAIECGPFLWSGGQRWRNFAGFEACFYRASAPRVAVGLTESGKLFWARGRGTLGGFQAALAALRRVTRWRLFKIMYYRTDLLTHSRRLSWQLRAAARDLTHVFGPRFNLERAIALALVHDDHEIILGDVQLANKIKMTDGQLAKLDQAERRAIDQTAAGFPEKIGPYVYRDLLLEKLDSKTLEAQIVTYFDKLEGYMEALHEIFAGNICFATPPVNHYGTHPIGGQAYIPILTEFGQKYPATAPLFGRDRLPFVAPAPLDVPAIAAASRPHTLASLRATTGNSLYDYWRQLMLAYADGHERENLYLQKEYPPEQGG